LPRNAPTTVVLARFDDLFGRGLHALIDSDENLNLLAADVEQRRMSVVLRAHRPDVAVLDAGALGKLAEVRELIAQHPRTRVVLFAEDPSMSVHAPLLAFGASACLGRDTQSRDVLHAIHLASRGMRVMPRAAPGPLAPAAPPGRLLTPREGEVLILLQHGDSNAQIAAALHIGIETVRTHAHRIYAKLGVASRRELRPPGQGTVPDATRPSRRRAGAPRASRARRGHGLRPG
jgi:DNA-binding NarL/FixJ family response regulator